MSKNSEIKYNIDPILKKINDVIVDGVNNIVYEFMDNYKMYEETHNTIMGLPIIKNILNGKKNMNYVSLIDSDDDCDDSMIQNIKNITSELVENAVNQKFNEKDTIIRQLLIEMNNLKSEISKLKDDSLFKNTRGNNEEPEIPIKREKDEYENIKLVIEQKETYESNETYILEIDLEESTEYSEEEHTRDVVETHITKEVKEVEQESETDDDQEEEEVETETSDTVEEESESEDEVDVETNKQIEQEDDNEAEEEEVETETSDTVEEESENEYEVEVETVKQIEKQPEEKDGEEETYFEIEIGNETYCTNNEENGFIFELDEDGDVGNKVGYLKEGNPFFYGGKK